MISGGSRDLSHFSDFVKKTGYSHPIGNFSPHKHQPALETQIKKRSDFFLLSKDKKLVLYKINDSLEFVSFIVSFNT